MNAVLYATENFELKNKIDPESFMKSTKIRFFCYANRVNRKIFLSLVEYSSIYHIYLFGECTGLNYWLV